MTRLFDEHRNHVVEVDDGARQRLQQVGQRATRVHHHLELLLLLHHVLRRHATNQHRHERANREARNRLLVVHNQILRSQNSITILRMTFQMGSIRTQGSCQHHAEHMKESGRREVRMSRAGDRFQFKSSFSKHWRRILSFTSVRYVTSEFTSK